MTAEVVEIIVPAVEVLEISAPATTLVEIVMQGPQGPMGPPNTTPLSIDAGNQLVLGTDGGFYAHTMWANTPDW
jgi:hypothetical protein